MFLLILVTALAIVGVAVAFLIQLVVRAETNGTKTDQLTGLGNRRWFIERLDKELKETPKDVVVLYCDLDRFQLVNDMHGLAVGDSALVAVAERLIEEFPEPTVVARSGNDEFVIISRAKGPDVAGIASRVIALLDRPVIIDDLKISTSFSIGIAAATDSPAPTAEELLRQADTALFRAKDAGGGTFAQFRHMSDDINTQERLDTRRDLVEAIENDELTVVYQPIVDRDYRITALEALVRWPHPTRGTIAPAEFLDVAREAGLIAVLGSQVMRRACNQVAAWRRETDRKDLRVNVNVDPQQFDEPTFIDVVGEILKTAGLPGNALVLEVREEMLTSLDGMAKARLDALTEMGVGVSIDDFGAGESSLSRIVELGKVAELKIDRAIVGVATDPKGLAIISAVVSMAEVLNLRLIAEGIERDDEEAAVIALGVSNLQGFRFAKPMPGESVVFDRPVLEIGQLPWNPSRASLG